MCIKGRRSREEIGVSKSKTVEPTEVSSAKPNDQSRRCIKSSLGTEKQVKRQSTIFSEFQKFELGLYKEIVLK